MLSASPWSQDLRDRLQTTVHQENPLSLSLWLLPPRQPDTYFSFGQAKKEQFSCTPIRGTFRSWNLYKVYTFSGTFPSNSKLKLWYGEATGKHAFLRNAGSELSPPRNSTSQKKKTIKAEQIVGPCLPSNSTRHFLVSTLRGAPGEVGPRNPDARRQGCRDAGTAYGSQ